MRTMPITQRILRNTIPALAVLALLFAALYSLFAETEDPVLAPFFASRAVVVGTIIRDPDVRESSLRLTVQPETVNGSAVRNSKRVLVSSDRFAGVSYGDRVRAVGTLRAPEAFETDRGRTFDYPNYLWARGISREMPFADVTVLESNAEKNPFVARLLSIKHALIRGIERALSEPYAALAEGLLLGEKQALGDPLYNAFVASGVVHIIVLSGYNVALVINSVLFISLRFLPRLAGYATAAVFVVAFAIMTGGSETTIRATIMALLMMVARVLHRPALALRGLLIAAGTMAIASPFLVLYDLSFQLSVVATFGLIVFSDRIAASLRFIPERFALREIVATTLATQITVLPLLVLSVGAVSLVFLPANALVLPAVPMAMLLSFIAAIAALLAPPFGALFGFPAYVLLSYIIAIPEFFGALPFASFAIPQGLAWAALGFIALAYMFALFWFFLRPKVFTPGISLKSPSRSDF